MFFDLMFSWSFLLMFSFIWGAWIDRGAEVFRHHHGSDVLGAELGFVGVTDSDPTKNSRRYVGWILVDVSSWFFLILIRFRNYVYNMIRIE